MRAATLFCILAAVDAWKMPPQASLLSKPSSYPRCTADISPIDRRATQPDSPKWHGSQRVPTELEMKHKDYLAEPYLHTIMYINLDRSADRKEHMTEQLQRTAPGFQFERFAAKTRSDAKALDKVAYTKNKKNEWASEGTIATYMSHWHILEQISKHNDSRAVFFVLEDDASLPDGWAQEAMCQIKRLPADWDLYKFGYWPLDGARWAYDHTCSGNIRQAKYNNYTCNQRSFALEWMGNIGYAVRPQGAAKAIEHLNEVPIMDVDGAMMPGCCISNSSHVPQNVYISRWPLIKHGKFHSVRLMDKLSAGTATDLTAISDGTDDRESSYAARVRISEAYKRGELAKEYYEPKEAKEQAVELEPKEIDDLEKDNVAALAGLGS